MNFYSRLEQYHDRCALVVANDRRVSYAELAGLSDKLGVKLNAGLAGTDGARALVVLLCENSLEALVGYVACLRYGAVPLLLSVEINQCFLDKLLDAYQPDLLWLPAERLHMLPKAVAKPTIHQLGHYVLLPGTARTTCSMHSQLALLLTTSGSTGSPLLVRQTYRNITSNANSIAQSLSLSADDRPITTLPFHYTYGLSIIHSHLLVGATIVLNSSSLLDREFWSLLGRKQATSFGGVPYSFEILKRLCFFRMEFPYLKKITQAGGKLADDLAIEFSSWCGDKGIAFYVMYGQVEATARMACLPSADAVKKAGSVGKPIPGGKFWLEDQQGQRIDTPDTVGELVYQGDNVTWGYARNRDDLQRGDENHGTLHTGDLARFDAEGYYYIVGRKKRFIKMFGHRVNLAELDNLITAEFGGACACTGSDDHLRVHFTGDASPVSVKEYVVRTTGFHHAAIKVYPIDTIPRNEAGKILYAALDEASQT